jgi:hypothetical protein
MSPGPEDFRKLPDPIRLEDTVVLVPGSAPSDPEGGRNVAQDHAVGVRETQ